MCNTLVILLPPPRPRDASVSQGVRARVCVRVGAICIRSPTLPVMTSSPIPRAAGPHARAGGNAAFGTAANAANTDGLTASAFAGRGFAGTFIFSVSPSRLPGQRRQPGRTAPRSLH